MYDHLPSSQDALRGIWKGLRDLARILGEPIPGEGDAVFVDNDEYDEMKKIEYTIRAKKLEHGTESTIEVSRFNDSLKRLEEIRRGGSNE